MLILKIVAPNGKVTTGKVDKHALIKVGAGIRYELVDSLTGLAPDDIRLKRMGRKLVLQSESQATTVELVNFYPAAEHLPVSASVSLPGAPATLTDSIASLAAETPVGDARTTEFSQLLSSDNLLADKMTGFEAFEAPVQLALAESATMSDVMMAAAPEAGAAGSSGAAGGATAGAGTGAAAAGGAALGTGATIGIVGAAVGIAAAAGGGGGSAASSGVAAVAATAAGKAIDGYLSKAVVFRDANNNKIWDKEAFVDTNNNGVRDTGETFTDTNADGAWTAETYVITDANGNWSGLGGSGGIVLTGLIAGNGNVLTQDISTGKTFNQVLTAPEGSTVVTPITTLISSLIAKGLTSAQAQDEVADSFGLDTNIDLDDYDPLLAATATSATPTQQAAALATQKVNIQLSSILSVAGQTANKVDATQTTAENSTAAFDALATSLQGATGTVDLSSTTTIQSVFDGIANTVDPALKAAFQAQDDNIVASLVSITNAVDGVALGGNVNTALTQIVATQIVAETNLINTVNTSVAPTGGTAIDPNAFSGANLVNAVDTAGQSVEDIVPSTNTVTTIGEPSRPVVTVGAGTAADTRITAADVTSGVHINVSLVGGTIPAGGTVATGGSLAAVGDKLVLLLNGTSVATYTLVAGDIPATGATTTHVFDGVDLGTDGSKSFAARLERGTTVGPTSNVALTTVDTVANAPSALALVAADDTGSSTTDGFTSKTTVKIQGSAESGSSVTVTDGTASATVFADSSNTFVATLSGLTAGSHSITATATDVAGNVSAASTAATIFVSTAPTGGATANQTVLEDAAFSLNASTVFADVDVAANGDVLAYSATGLPQGITINAATGVISGATGDAGVNSNPNNVTVTATDKAGATATSTFTLAVTNVNDVPTGKVAITGSAAKTQVLTATAGNLADDDGLGTLSYQWQVSSDGTTFANVPGATSAALPALTSAEVGKFFQVVASYTDLHGTAETSTSLPTVAVRDNLPPTGNVTVTGTAKQYQTLTASNNLADGDGPATLAISYQWQSSTDGTTFTDIAGATSTSFTLTSEALVGKQIRVQAKYTDGLGTQEAPASTGQVIANDPLVFSSGATGTVAENAAITTAVYTAAAADSQHAATTYSLTGTDAALFDINAGTGVVTLKASANFESKASYSIGVTASDGADSSTQAVVVSVTNVNEAPTVANPIANMTAGKDVAYSFVVPANTFADVDAGDATLALSATTAAGGTLPAWLTFNAGTRTFSGTPAASDIGVTSVRVTAKDGGLLSAFEDFDLTVSNNSAPVVAAATTKIINASNSPSLDLGSIFSDPGDVLSYALTGTLPAGLTFNSNGIISGTTTASTVAPTAVSITATDSGGLTATTALKIYANSVGALIPVLTKGNFDVDGDSVLDGTKLKLELKYDSTKDPDAGGVGSLDVTLRYDVANYTAYNQDPTAVTTRSIFALGNTGSSVAAGESVATPGSISVGYIKSPATTATTQPTIMTLFFDIKTDTGIFQAKADITGFDSVTNATQLAAISTNAWLLTT